MASGQGPIYDDSITFPTNKTDGGQTSTPTTFPAVEANNQGAFNYATRTAIRSGIYQGALDQSASLPPLSSGTPSALSTTWTSNGGQLSVSEAGAPYVWVKSYNRINLGDKRFGLKADWNGATGTDDTAAWQAAINVTASVFPGTPIRNILVLPKDIQSRVTGTPTVPGNIGFTMEGEGEWSSQMIADPATPNADCFVINSSAFTRLEGLAILGLIGNPAGKMLTYGYSPVVTAAYFNKLTNVMLSFFVTPGGSFDTGIFLSNLHGNNSEFTYDHVSIIDFATVGLDITGTQQLGHAFLHSNILGNWNAPGADPSTPGGLYGIRCSGGGFTFDRSNASSVRGAVFEILGTNDLPLVIDGLDSEGAYRIVGPGSPSPGAGIGATSITNSRFAFFGDGSFDPNGVINSPGQGALTITGNTFATEAGATTFPRILIAAGAARGICIRRNIWRNPNSVSMDPVNVTGTAVNVRAQIDAGDNWFVDGSFLPAVRNERINTVPPVTSDAADLYQPTTVDDLWWLDLTQFKAAAASQIIQFRSNILATQKFVDFYAYLYNYIVGVGGTTYTFRAGITSGGDELISDVVIGDSIVGDGHAIYGVNGTASRGAGFAGGAVYAGNPLATSSVYVKLTASTGNLGNGTVSNITRGILHLLPEYKLIPRYIL